MNKEKRILSIERPALISEWDFVKNMNICSPDNITVGSGQKVWWICQKHHSYQMAIYKRSDGVGCPFCGNRKILAGFNDLKTVKPELIEEWDYQNNTDINPETIGVSYREKVSWVCKECGSRWKATVLSRTHTGCGCPICKNKKISDKMIARRTSDSSNLAVLFPDLIKEWDPANSYSPYNLCAQSSITVGWICKEGHHWKTSVCNRTRGNGCPFCAGKKIQIGYNDLQTVAPLLAKEWCFSKNGNLLPTQVTAGSNRKVWWTCKNGHDYEMTISNRKQGKQCPYCSGQKVLVGFNDLPTTNPDVIALWDYSKNVLSPAEVSSGSNKSVYWKCSTCNGEWHAKISNITNGQRCPYCAGKRILVGFNDLQFTDPDISKQWCYEKNGALSPTEFTAGSGKKVWWNCEICGNTWQATIYSRTKLMAGCPKCARRSQTSFPEQAIYYYLKKVYPDAINGYKDIFDDGMELDIFIPSIKVAIEYDGLAWHRGDSSLQKERKKYAICKSHKIKLYRVKESKNKEDHDLCDFIVYCDGHATDYYKEVNCVINKLFQEMQLGITVDLEMDANTIRESYYSDIQGKSIEVVAPDVCKDWDYEKNHGLIPSMFKPQSNVRVWWKCHKCGYEWEAGIDTRFGKHGCPACANQVVWVGHNDLQSKYPRVADEWNTEKNNGTTPYIVTAKSGKKVWWKCKVGHEWQATIYQRTQLNTGCPYCAGKRIIPGVTDLLSVRPDLAEEWDYSKNKDVLISSVGIGSHKKVWWICKNGHEWQATIYSRKKGQCPFCFGKRRELV